MNTKNIKQHLPLIFAISYADHRLVVNPPPSQILCCQIWLCISNQNLFQHQIERQTNRSLEAFWAHLHSKPAHFFNCNVPKQHTVWLSFGISMPPKLHIFHQVVDFVLGIKDYTHPIPLPPSIPLSEWNCQLQGHL